MKKTLILAIMAAIILVIAGCEQFTTSYQRIDDSEFRLLDFVYVPADASPGDTVTLMAVFAGKEVELDGYLDWSISLNVIRDFFGSETVVDSTPMRHARYVERFDTAFSPNTQTVGFKIKLPDSTIRNSASIPDTWTDMLPSYMVNMIPPSLRSMTKNQVIDLIEAYCENPRLSGIPQDFMIPLLQFFTVPIRISVKINDPAKKYPHTIRSSRTIRYNSRVAKANGSGLIPVNNNPSIRNVAIHKVKGENILEFDNKNGLKYSTIRLNMAGNAIVEIEEGYSYFIDADIYDSRNFDWTITMDGGFVPEILATYHQFQLDKNEIAHIHHSKYMSVNNMTGKITPPTDKGITKFTFWVTVKDEVMNERMRPVGSMLAEGSGRFVYR